jgi:hypothetical protein
MKGNMDKIKRVKEIAEALRAMFPEGHLQLDISEETTLNCFAPKTYAESTEFFRELGIQVRTKIVYPSFTSVSGERDEVIVKAYPDELPPTCRKVKKIERIPKTATVETGEFIEVEREVIECGNGERLGHV